MTTLEQPAVNRSFIIVPVALLTPILKWTLAPQFVRDTLDDQDLDGNRPTPEVWEEQRKRREAAEQRRRQRDLQITGLPNHQIAGLPSPQIATLPSLQIVRLPSLQIAGLPNHQITGLPNRQTAGLPSPQIARLPNHQIAGLPNRQIARLTNRQIAGLPSRHTAGGESGNARRIDTERTKRRYPTAGPPPSAASATWPTTGCGTAHTTEQLHCTPVQTHPSATRQPQGQENGTIQPTRRHLRLRPARQPAGLER